MVARSGSPQHDDPCAARSPAVLRTQRIIHSVVIISRMMRPHEKLAVVQILAEDLIQYGDLPNANDGGLEDQVSAVCGPPHEQRFRRVQIPIDLLPEDIAIEDLDAAVAHGEPGAAGRRALIERHAKSLRSGRELDEIVVVNTDIDIGVLDGRHRVAAARVAGRTTLEALESVGQLRGYLFEPQNSVEDSP